jgi:acyl-coenzyme A synthetase/AMP-(fatty) acid ligase
MHRLDHFLSLGALQEPTRLFLRDGKDWTYGAANEEVDERAALYRRQSSGLPVCLRGVNSASWVINLLALVRAGIPAILVPAEMTESEATSLIQIARTPYRVEDKECVPTGITSSPLPDWFDHAVGLGFATSGSTGQPRIALRSHASLTDEGLRFQALWNANTEDVFFALAPLSHAYTFGAALAAALVAKATLALAPFRSPHTASAQISEWNATIVPLVPAMARTLALVDQGRPVQSNLRIVMAGAGHASQDLSELFSLRWGLALSRNYGSSETGAVLASLAPTPDEITGAPMQGIACELAEGSENLSLQLWVRLKYPPVGYVTHSGYEPALLSPGGWWATGDLFERTPKGGLRLVGRRGAVIRRAGHSIQPREIEAALLSASAVSEAYVKGSLDWNGEECIEAHVTLKNPGSIKTEDLHQYLTTKLAPHKLPNRWYFYDSLPKTWSDKVNARRLISAGSSQPSLIQALQGFRLSHAVTAAHDIGLLQELQTESQTVEALAMKLSCSAGALFLFLEYLSSAGLLNRTGLGYTLAQQPHSGWLSLSDFEAILRSTWLSPDQIVAVLRNGLDNRAFEQEASAGEFSRLYTEAFCGPWQEFVALLLRRKLRMSAGATALEVGRGAGRITLHLRTSFHLDCRFCGLGPAPSVAWRDLPEAEREKIYSWDSLPISRDSLDAIILTNCVHWLRPQSAPAVLTSLAAALRPQGSLAIVDSFVDTATGSSQFLLDWLTHGGLHWTRLQQLKDQLSQAGFSSFKTEPIGEGIMQLVTCDRSAQPQQQQQQHSHNQTSGKGKYERYY